MSTCDFITIVCVFLCFVLKERLELFKFNLLYLISDNEYFLKIQTYICVTVEPLVKYLQSTYIYVTVESLIKYLQSTYICVTVEPLVKYLQSTYICVIVEPLVKYLQSTYIINHI